MDEENPFIRPPDEVVQAQLIEDTRSEYEQQLEEAMQRSMEDLYAEREKQRLHEDALKQSHLLETETRKSKFTDFLKHLRKVAAYDGKVRDIYDIILPILESYCDGLLERCELDEVTHTIIFQTLQKVRVSAESLDQLRSILRVDTDTTNHNTQK